jgi:hypothetical protein
MVFGSKSPAKAGAKGPPARMEDVSALISKKNYARAIEVIREQLKTNGRDPRLRLQLSDVLVMAGKGPQAIVILDPLADEFARDGFAAKAISVLKKIQKIDPNRRDVDNRLASLIEEKQRVAVVYMPAPSAGGMELGMEEIGMELPMDSTLDSARDPGPPLPEIAAEPRAGFEIEPEFEPESEPAIEPEIEPEPPTEPVSAAARAAALERARGARVERPADEVPAFDFGDEAALASAEDPLPLGLDLPAPVEDRDLFLDDGEVDTIEPEVEAEPELAAVTVEPELEPTGPPMSQNAFADELMSVIDEAFSGLAMSGEGEPALEGMPQDTGAGNQIVVSPLFRHFSVDEMVAVIQGLKLLSFGRGKVIIKQGDKGDSLYMLTAGSVRAFMKKDGKQQKVGDLDEGAFFGEVSILTGKPRSATIVALTDCELLELDRPTLDGIAEKHPHVWDVLEEFGRERASRQP